jgi:hypothetical protein
MSDGNEAIRGLSLIAIIMVLAIGCVGGGCYGYPKYRVYQQQMEGEAKLREAESSRQIAVEEAKAKLDSSKMLADAAEIEAEGKGRAEVSKAKATAEAVKIVGASLKEHPDYKVWMFLDGVKDNTNQIIYWPTESGMPITEMGRLLLNRDRQKATEQRAEAEKAKAGIAD